MEKLFKNQWEEKYYRESWTMPFGSIMNAYAQNIQGKGKSVECMIKDIDLLYEKAQGLIEDSLKKDIKPLTDKEVEYGKQTFQEKYNEQSELDEINSKINEEKEQLF